MADPTYSAPVDAQSRLAAHLRALKQERGLSLAEIGGRTHFSRASWERWLNGKRPISPGALASFADLVGVDRGPLLAMLAQARREGEEATAQNEAQPWSYQLPRGTGHFVGRTDEVGALLDLAAEAEQQHGSGLEFVAAVDGMPGVGKTALALHVAHLVRDRFPDGQLYLDLRAHPGQSNEGPRDALTPVEAAHRILRATGVAEPRVAEAGNEAVAEVLRRHLAGARLLIVLDDVADTPQIRPLLSGLAGCLILITGRRRLIGLDEALTVSLEPLPEMEALDLLARVAGADRAPKSAAGSREVVELCGGLPLALCVAGTRLRRRRGTSVADLAARLRPEPGRLELLRDEDRDVGAVIAASYLRLPADEQAAFMTAARHGNVEFAAPDRAGQVLLDQLVERNLVIEVSLGRYRMHPLVISYALGAVDPAE